MKQIKLAYCAYATAWSLVHRGSSWFVLDNWISTFLCHSRCNFRGPLFIKTPKWKALLLFDQEKYPFPCSLPNATSPSCWHCPPPTWEFCSRIPSHCQGSSAIGSSGKQIIFMILSSRNSHIANYQPSRKYYVCFFFEITLRFRDGLLSLLPETQYWIIYFVIILNCCHL